jgi:hypothetical protein
MIKINKLNNLKTGDYIKILVDIANPNSPKFLSKGSRYKVKYVSDTEIFASRFITLENDNFYMLTENLEYIIDNN